MKEQLKDFVFQMISYFSIYELGILLLIFFCFILFFTLGLLLRGRRFIAGFFFFLSICVIFSTPITLQLAMTKFFYKIQVDITTAHPMEYTKGFFVAGNIIHQGKIAINECRITANEVREEEKNTLIKYINAVLPKSSFSTKLEIEIQPQEEKTFAIVVPHFEAKKPFNYRIYVDCYFSNNILQTLQHKSKAKKDKDEDEENTSQSTESQETHQEDSEENNTDEISQTSQAVEQEQSSQNPTNTQE
uniref:DUF2393 domain-containing protein n=1 Tax=uncultured Helicobacter sp. TaxID=175537 RepID=A0A650ELC1_9HELI|nr:hypothetical protein Helico4rc_1810 [uncultured Helicobacter sp.]